MFSNNLDKLYFMVVTNDVVEGDEHRLTVFETFEML